MVSILETREVRSRQAAERLVEIGSNRDRLLGGAADERRPGFKSLNKRLPETEPDQKIEETQERSKGVSLGTLPATSGPAATAGLRKSAGPPASTGSQTKCRKVSEVSEGEGSFTPLTR